MSHRHRRSQLHARLGNDHHVAAVLHPSTLRKPQDPVLRQLSVGKVDDVSKLNQARDANDGSYYETISSLKLATLLIIDDFMTTPILPLLEIPGNEKSG